nr:unnamed protein product [Callosobruchus analis]
MYLKATQDSLKTDSLLSELLQGWLCSQKTAYRLQKSPYQPTSKQ